MSPGEDADSGSAGARLSRGQNRVPVPPDDAKPRGAEGAGRITFLSPAMSRLVPRCEMSRDLTVGRTESSECAFSPVLNCFRYVPGFIRLCRCEGEYFFQLQSGCNCSAIRSKTERKNIGSHSSERTIHRPVSSHWARPASHRCTTNRLALSHRLRLSH